jgi:glucose-6-phosphate isomerase
MLQLDISHTLGKIITPSLSIPSQELAALGISMHRHIEEWLKERSNGLHAWSMDTYDGKMLQSVKEVAMSVKAKGIRTVLWVGIGGSGLGPTVIHDVFKTPKTVKFIVIDTIDPAELTHILSSIDWHRTLFVVASKSGDTLEPMSVFFLLWEQLQKQRKLRPQEHVVAITDPEQGSLHDFCLQHDIPILPIPSGVGERYSIFSPIGLLPLALLDGDVRAFVRGASEMDTLCQSTVLNENPAALLAAVQFFLDTKRGYHVRVIMSYSARLRSLTRWNQQLIAESLGKTETKNPIPLAAMGTQDQHSFLQQWMAGPRTFWHLFIRESEKLRISVPEEVPEEWKFIAGKTFGQLLDACYEGTSQALTSVKRPHATITLTRLDSGHLGQLFFLLLAEVTFLGKLYRIDPYGQPAVEVGKQMTKQLLARGGLA